MGNINYTGTERIRQTVIEHDKDGNPEIITIRRVVRDDATGRILEETSSTTRIKAEITADTALAASITDLTSHDTRLKTEDADAKAAAEAAIEALKP